MSEPESAARYMKYLVRHEASGHVYWNAYMMSSRYDGSLDHYRQMAEVIAQTFPQAGPDQVECTRVIQSRWCKGFPVVRFGLMSKDGRGEYRSFEPTEDQKSGWRVGGPIPDATFA